MFKLLALCLVAVLISSALAGEDGRIVNGQIIDIKNAPYAVQLRRRNFCFCGGTLIAPTFVLSAAHCVDKKGIEDLVAVGNANRIDEAGISRRVIKATYPSGYSRETGLNMDIAVLKLESPMTGGVIKTLPMATVPWQAGKTVQVSGWGLLSFEGQASSVLRTVFLESLTHDDCLKKNFYSRIGSETKECAFGKNKDACQGDSGGPAVIDGKLAGVVSSGKGCADDRYPGVYTSVFTMSKFVNDAMRTL